MRHRRLAAIWVCAAALLGRSAWGDAFDPPPAYYSTATSTGATLKSQLNSIIKTGHTPISYDALRSALQVTDADPDNPGHILLVYDRASLNVAAINPGGPIPGWDNGSSWNREHTWPISRGLGSESMPDGSDLHHLRPSTSIVNSNRANRNFGGAFGQPFGIVTDSAAGMWYPGDADAGMIARHEFYMAVRYDGADGGTTNLELASGSPAESGTLLGDLNRLVEWHFAAPPDSFERRRNQIIYDTYQHNRNPFIDRPEFAWSVFVNNANDSQISIDGAGVGGDGQSIRFVDLGRVYVGGSLPAGQVFSLNKAGSNGTYFDVTTIGAATSSLTGRHNAFRTNQIDSRPITVGLNTNTATAGVRTGVVTIDNLDITTGGGSGRGANDANDTFNVSMVVLDRPVASFSLNVETREQVIDFGVVPIGSGLVSVASLFTNLATGGFPELVANLDLDQIHGLGDTGVFHVDLDLFRDLPYGDYATFYTLFYSESVGNFAATYTLTLSDEDLPGEQTQTLTLTLMAQAILSGDYNGDNLVDAADYVVWRQSVGQSVLEYSGADGNGDGTVDDDDYHVWCAHFGSVAAGAGSIDLAAVPEPASVLLIAGGFIVCHCLRRARRREN